mgnify:CR=1 FL=1
MKKNFFFFASLLISLEVAAQPCPAPTAGVDLQINNVRARILNGGDLWWNPTSQTNYYTVPIGSGKNALFAGSVWFGGMDGNGQIYAAAQTYRQAGSNDFWPGPISKNPGTGALSISPTTCGNYDHLFHALKADVQNFLNSGISTIDIQTWPGNGNVAAGELPSLAPYFDANNDGLYSAMNGDYPYFNFSNSYPTNPNTGQKICEDYLFGDEVLWWVFNDIGNSKTETNSQPIGIEVRAMAFAYNMPGSDLNNTTFYKYQIINRSSTTFHDFHAGFWVDPDLGNSADDYVGCDIGRSIGYVYNGDADDDGPVGYGLLPPAVGLDMLRGPLADNNDFIDNDHDGVTDEPDEECLMGAFMYYVNMNGVPTGNPALTSDYYKYLSGIWIDSAPVTYGGDGRGNGGGATSIATTYMFPGTTNPAFTTPWTMGNAQISPDDMRFLVSSSPFTMQPGEVNYATYAAIWARTTSTSAMPSVAELQNASDIVQAFFDNCFTVTGLNQLSEQPGIVIGPNPSSSTFTVNASRLNAGSYSLKVFDAASRLVETFQFNSVSTVLTIGSKWSKGVYYFVLEGENYRSSTKVVKQ